MSENFTPSSNHRSVDAMAGATGVRKSAKEIPDATFVFIGSSDNGVREQRGLSPNALDQV